MIRGLDDDEVDFLSIVDQAKMDAERRQQIEDNKEMRDFRERVATLQENTIDQVCVARASDYHLLELPFRVVFILLVLIVPRSLVFVQKISTERAVPKANAAKASSRPSQKSILAGIVRKRTANEALGTANGAKSDAADVPAKQGRSSEADATAPKQEAEPTAGAASTVVSAGANDKGALKCIGILPGIGKYEDSSDSEKSTDTDDEYNFRDFDWMGRKIKKDGQCE